MSFSSQVKNELSRHLIEEDDQKKFELAALIRTTGSLLLSGNQRIGLDLTIEYPFIVRKVFRLFKQLYNVVPLIENHQKDPIRKNGFFKLKLSPEHSVTNMLLDLQILHQENDLTTIQPDLPDFPNQKSLLSYVKGLFLGCGSIANPEKNYHLEFSFSDKSFALSCKQCMRKCKLFTKYIVRKSQYVIYTKDSQQIELFLNLIGAHNAYFKFLEIRMIKQVRNTVNRRVNCETANLTKTVATSQRQLRKIEYIIEKKGLSYLPKNLQEIAALRMRYKELSLEELGLMMKPQIGKSGVHHRLKKIERIADELKEGTGQ